MRARLALAALLVLPLAGCLAAAKGSKDGPEQAFVRLFAADAAGDAEAVAGCYTAEAVLLPPGGKPIVGREEILAHYAQIFEEVTLEMSSKAEIGRVADTMAWHVGRSFGSKVDKETGERAPFDDRYVAILELCEDGLWRVSALSWAPAR